MVFNSRPEPPRHNSGSYISDIMDLMTPLTNRVASLEESVSNLKVKVATIETKVAVFIGIASIFASFIPNLLGKFLPKLF